MTAVRHRDPAAQTDKTDETPARGGCVSSVSFDPAGACRICGAGAAAFLPDGTPVCAGHNRALVRLAVALGARLCGETKAADLMCAGTTANVTDYAAEQGELL